MFYLDLRTSQCENELWKIVHLRQMANQSLDALLNAEYVTKLHIRDVITLTKVIVPIE